MAERSEHAPERDLPSLDPLNSENQVCGGSSYSLSFPSQPPDVRNWFSSYEFESPASLGLPSDLGGFLLLEGDGDETQDPLEISAMRKDENPPTVEHKHFDETLLHVPAKRNSCYSLRLQNESRPWSGFHSSKGKGNLLLGMEKKTFSRYEDADDGDRDLGLSGVDENLVKDCKQSMKRLPTETEGTEHVLHQECPRSASPVLSPKGVDLAVANEVPHKQELLPRCSIRMDGFISVKKMDPVRVDSETSKSKLGSEVRCENLSASERNIGNISGEVQNPKSNSLGVKRKQNLQQLFGEEFLANYCKEDADDLPSLQLNRSLIKDQKCAENGCFEQSEPKKKLGAEDWRRDGNISSVGGAERKVEGEIALEKEPLDKESSPMCAYQELRENAATISAGNEENIRSSGENLPPRPIKTMDHKDTSSKNGVTGRETNGHMLSEGLIMQEHRNLSGKEQSQTGKRLPLVDKTNLESAARAPEIPGKWRCPRNSKPHMGPPLKQLRLERWVHRVN